MMLQRLVRGSLSAVADRGRQELYKSFGRLGARALLAAPAMVTTVVRTTTPAMAP